MAKSRSVKAERFDGRGHRIETVELTVNEVTHSVYLHVEGRGPAKQFVMSRAAWAVLIGEAAPEPPAPEPTVHQLPRRSK
jgi:hypothetical protein